MSTKTKKQITSTAYNLAHKEELKARELCIDTIKILMVNKQS